MQNLTKHESWYGGFDKSHIEKIHQWEEKAANDRQGELCKKHFENCSKFVKHIRIGDPAQEVLKSIEEEDIDIVAICRKGESGRFKIGSVADKIIRNSPVSVVIVSHADEK